MNQCQCQEMVCSKEAEELIFEMCSGCGVIYMDSSQIFKEEKQLTNHWVDQARVSLSKYQAQWG